jgi:hypothetical protein
MIKSPEKYVIVVALPSMRIQRNRVSGMVSVSGASWVSNQGADAGGFKLMFRFLKSRTSFS